MKNQPKADDVLKAVRTFCLECGGGSRDAVETCIIHNCPLYPYRSVSAIQRINGGSQIDMFSIEREERKNAG